ncbi:cytokine receptor common subunit beta [Sardina pilchardus]|uniref:cytokine receptor common subunit beta n=1 Tax=Sardina pilchardus TaxID=27697 RepID=UPI002E14E251
MHLSWAVCLLRLPLLVLALENPACQTPHTAPNRTLECYNDYFNDDNVRVPRDYAHNISCSWTQCHSNRTLALSYENGSPCVVTERRAVSDGEVKVTCVYDGSDISYTIGRKYKFFFHSHHHVAKPTNLTTNLFQHVHVMTPENLTVKTQDGVHQLSWHSPYDSSSNLTSDLHYQVTYGTAGQDWTTLHSNHTVHHIKGETLLPGRHYKAKVRARAGPWQWSQWSPLVEWKTKDELGPSEFQCVIDSVSMVTCGWKLRREHAQFLDYHLSCYHLSNTTSVPCCPSPSLTSDPSAALLEFRCLLNVSDPQDLRVELTPTEHSRTFKSWKYIQPPSPARFRVEEKDKSWVLRWDRPNVQPNVKLCYQLRYKPKESEEWKPPISLCSTSTTFSPNQLLPDTTYVARIQTLLDQSGTYDGKPSAWSITVEWTTPPAGVSLATILYIMVAVVVVLIFTFMVVTLPKCQKRIHDWKRSIPSPTHSNVLSEVIKRKASDWLYVVSEKEKVSMCTIQDQEDTHSRLSSCKERLWPCADDEDGDRDSLQLVTYQTGSTTGGRSAGSGPLDSSGMSFNGPYIFFRKESGPSSSQSLQHPRPPDHDDAVSSCGSPSSELASPCSSSPSSLSLSLSSSLSSSLSPVSAVSFLSSLSSMPGGYVATLQMSVPMEGAAPSDDDDPDDDPDDANNPADLALCALIARDPGDEDDRSPALAPSWQSASSGEGRGGARPPLPTDRPPAYTLQPPALHTVVLPRPSGYCSLPSLDLSGWASSCSSSPAAPPPAPAPPETDGAPAAVTASPSCPRPPEGDQGGSSGGERRQYVRLKTGYTTLQSDPTERRPTVQSDVG